MVAGAWEDSGNVNLGDFGEIKDWISRAHSEGNG
jgi:hypothetical protein